MIPKIKVFSKKKFYDFCRGLHLTKETIDTQEGLKRHYIIISICNISASKPDEDIWYANGCNTHYFNEGPNVLNLDFDDFTNDIEGAMTLEDAERIRDFIIPFIDSTEPIELIIHCSAGLSRSFSVGEFIYDYINYKQGWKPSLEASIASSTNYYVKDKLKQVFYGLDKD